MTDDCWLSVKNSAQVHPLHHSLLPAVSFTKNNSLEHMDPEKSFSFQITYKQSEMTLSKGMSDIWPLVLANVLHYFCLSLVWFVYSFFQVEQVSGYLWNADLCRWINQKNWTIRQCLKVCSYAALTDLRAALSSHNVQSSDPCYTESRSNSASEI